MKRKFLSILLTLAMALTLLPTAAMAEETPAETPAGEVGTPAAENVAQIGTQGYETLAAAVAAVKDNETITLLSDVALPGHGYVNLLAAWMASWRLDTLTDFY